MAQIVPVQPAMQAEPQIQLNQGTSQPAEAFSPHLDSAISKQNNTNSNSQASNNSSDSPETSESNLQSHDHTTKNNSNHIVSEDNSANPSVTNLITDGARAGGGSAPESLQVNQSSVQAADTLADEAKGLIPSMVGINLSEPIQVSENLITAARQMIPAGPAVTLPRAAATSNENQMFKIEGNVSEGSAAGNTNNLSTTGAQNPGTAFSKVVSVEQSLENILRAGATGKSIPSQTPLNAKTTSTEPSVFAKGSTPDPLVGQNIYSKQPEDILSRLERVIRTGNETGTVTIKTQSAAPPANSPAPLNIAQIDQATSSLRGEQLATASAVKPTVVGIQTSSGNSGSIETYLSVDGDEVPFSVAPKASQDLPSLRQDSQQQYFGAKLNGESINGANKNSEQQQTGDFSGKGQSTNESHQSSINGSGEKAGVFSMPTTASTETILPQLTDTAKPVILPSGSVVQEHEILQQLIERFQISRRQLNTRINIKLHPAELGEMKIDLTVKEGSIRANVVAQTQVVQEILEKNLAKLKTILEDQGFSIDEITFATESDSVGEFNLFDEHFANNNSFSESNKKNKVSFEPFMNQDITEESEVIETTGVNVKV